MVKTLSSPLNFKEAASAVLQFFHGKGGPKPITSLGEACLQSGFYMKKGLFWWIGNHEKISIRHDGWLHSDNGRIKTVYNDLNATAGVGNFLQGAQMKDGMCS
ncbi:hypothetical protein V6N13_091630 [Hibiscus sabdariffa]